MYSTHSLICYRFDQRRPDHFSGLSHRRMNSMLYPEMTADVRSYNTAFSRSIKVRAAVSGFELDLAPSFPSYIFALIDVYRDGKQQLDRFLPHPSEANESSPPRTKLNIGDSSTSTAPTSEIVIALDFQSGRVQFHADDTAAEPVSTPMTAFDPSFPDPTMPSALDSDVFKLPYVTVWLEYRSATSREMLSHLDTGKTRLTFNAIIHSSQNIIRPSLLPFVTEVTRQIEARLAEDSASQPRQRPSLNHQSSQAITQVSTSNVIGSTEIIFSLRIDQSNLEFTCLPDVNVNAGLHWKSGGFVLRVAPGAQEVSVVGSIEGISTSLRHGYLVDDCFNASARGLAFAVTFAQAVETGVAVNAISVVIDTEIIGSVRFGRLQDILCFKAVWLDRIPVFEGTDRSTAPSSPVLLPVAGKPQKAFVTSVLVQIESLQLDVDLGQAITKLTLDLRPVVVRTRLTNGLVEISVVSQLVKLDAVRAISGRIALPNLSFETIRRRRNTTGVDRTMLELAIRTGELVASVNYEGKKILLLR